MEFDIDDGVMVFCLIVVLAVAEFFAILTT